MSSPGNGEFAPPIKVTQFQRGPGPGSFSVERLFAEIRAALPADIDVEVRISRFPDKGLVPRLRNAIDVWRARAQINHVLGDTQYLAWFLPRRRTVMSVLDCVSLERLRGARRKVFWFLYYWWPLRRSREVVVISEFTRRNLARWVQYDDTDITTIHPPLAPGFTYSAPRPHGDWSRLLMVGTAPHKNLERVVEAIAGLEVTLAVVGPLSDERKTLLRRSNLRHEHLEGLDDAQLIDAFRKCDVLIFPSTYEGWGMPIIEAQATGRPVVTANVASMPESAGGAACLVDPRDVASIRGGIVRILSDRDYALGLIAAGRENARKYDARALAEQFALVYRRVAARNLDA